MNNQFRRLLGCVMVATLTSQTLHAGQPGAPPQAFHQLILPESRLPSGYRPTIQVVFASDGAQLPIDDANLRFNQLWLLQHDAEYEYRDGGSAIAELLRESVKSLYRDYRRSDRAPTQLLPDENGRGGFGRYSSEFNYDIRLKSDEFKLGLEYSF